MSTESTDEFEEIDGLEETRDAINSALEEADQLETSLNNAIEQLSSKQDELNEEQLAQIQTSFEQGLAEEWRTLESATGDYQPGEFEEQVANILDDFNSILQRPEAESVIEELEEWLVENGRDPFDADERDKLVEITENKVESARDTLSTLRESANDVLTRLKKQDDRFMKLIRDEISDVNTVGGMRNLSEYLTTIDENWLFPWSFESDDESTDQIRSAIDDMLHSQMGNIITESDSLSEISTLVSERFDGIDDTLVQLEEDAKRISSLYSMLSDSDFPEAANVASARLEERLERADRVSEVSSALEESIDDLEKMKHLAEADLQRFESDRHDVSEDLHQLVDTAETKGNKAASTREDVFSGGSNVDYTDVREEFDTAVSKADKALDSISSRIKGYIKTSEQLAKTFDLTEYSGSLNELKLNAERADQLDELLDIADEHHKIRVNIRNDIQEELDENLGVLLEWALGRDDTVPMQTEEIEQVAEEHAMTQADVIEGVIELQEKGLVELTIRGT